MSLRDVEREGGGGGRKEGRKREIEKNDLDAIEKVRGFAKYYLGMWSRFTINMSYSIIIAIY